MGASPVIRILAACLLLGALADPATGQVTSTVATRRSTAAIDAVRTNRYIAPAIQLMRDPQSAPADVREVMDTLEAFAAYAGSDSSLVRVAEAAMRSLVEAGIVGRTGRPNDAAHDALTRVARRAPQFSSAIAFALAHGAERPQALRRLAELSVLPTKESEVFFEALARLAGAEGEAEARKLWSQRRLVSEQTRASAAAWANGCRWPEGRLCKQ